jgi:LPS export ABC transporter protein LptC
LKISKYILFLSVVLIFCLFACDTKSKRAQQFFSQDDTAVEVGKQVEILYSDSAFVRVRVTSSTLHNYTDRENPRQEFPNGLKVEFLEDNLQVKSTLTAKTATRYNDKGLIIARDSVVLTTIKQEKLETEELTWDEKKKQVSTEKFVKVTNPNEVIYGYGLTANQDFSYWKITVPKGKIKVTQLDKALE